MRIIGTGSALPEREVTNDELSRLVDTSDEWISTRTGIKTRHVLTHERLDELARDAALRAMEDAGITADALDFIIVSTVQGEWVSPGMGCVIQGHIGAKCPTVDINGACAGFVYALDMADAYISSGRANTILIVAAEAASRFCDWTDRSTCVLFGDGAGAAVVTAGKGLIKTRLTVRSDKEVLYMCTPRGNSPYSTTEIPDSYLHMKGQDVYRAAVTHSNEDIRYLLEWAGLAPDAIKYYILHQANKRILDAIASRLKLREDQLPHSIEYTGNTSSAGCAMLLDRLNRGGALQNGDRVIFSAFGAGFTTGAALLEWNRG